MKQLKQKAAKQITAHNSKMNVQSDTNEVLYLESCKQILFFVKLPLNFYKHFKGSNSQQYLKKPENAAHVVHSLLRIPIP